MERLDSNSSSGRGARYLLALLAALLLPLPALAQLGPLQPSSTSPPVSDELSAAIDWETFQRQAKLNYQFGGALMTDERARSIAGDAGYTYLSWQICPGGDDCIMLEVEGKKGRIFQYMVLGARCSAAIAEAHELPGGKLSASDVARPRSHARTRVGSLPSTATAGTNPGSISTSGAGAGESSQRSLCFGGFISGVRTSQHQLFFIDHQGYLFSVEQVFQFLIDGTWTTGFSGVATAWQTPQPSSGLTERGTAYEWRDASGQVLDGDGESVLFIASSGSTEAPTLEQLCRAEEALTKSWGTFLSEGVAGLLILLPVPDKFSGEASAEPFGIGAKLVASKDWNYVQAFRNMLLGAGSVASSQTYLDCLKHPGTYDPGNFGPDPASFDLEGIKGFEVIHPEVIGFEGSCPIARHDVVEKELAGVHCTITTDYTCHSEPNAKTGVNDCACTQTEQTQVCSGGI